MSRNRQKQSDLLAIERRQGQRLEQIAAQRRAVTVASIETVGYRSANSEDEELSPQEIEQTISRGRYRDNLQLSAGCCKLKRLSPKPMHAPPWPFPARMLRGFERAQKPGIYVASAPPIGSRRETTFM